MFDPTKIKLGIAPIGWTNDDLPELGGDISFERCIKEMEIAGFAGTEIGSKFPKDVDVLKNKLKQHGLQIASQWFSAHLSDPAKKDETVSAFRMHMNKLKDLGAEVIVVSEQNKSIQGQISVPVLQDKPVLNDEEWGLFVRGLEEIGKLAQKEGMKIVYHHHMGTVIQTRDEIDRLMDNTDPELVFLLADTGHMYYSDGAGSPAQLIKDYGERIAHIHLKDIRESVKKRVRREKLSFLQGVIQGVFTVPGDGDINFPDIFEAIKRAGYEGWFVVEAEQDPSKADPLEYAQNARAYIRETTGL